MKRLQERLTKNYPAEAAEWAIEHAEFTLGVEADDISPSLEDDDAGRVLGVKSNTIKVWRCTGDRKTQYSKSGRSANNSTLPVLNVLIESGRAVAP